MLALLSSLPGSHAQKSSGVEIVLLLHSRDSRDKEHKDKPGDKHNFFCSLLDIIENDVKPSPILFYDGARDERATVTTSLYFSLFCSLLSHE